jgi:hypothetical protein
MSIKDNLSDLNEITNSSLERMNALGELNMKLAEQMATRQMDLMSRCLEQGAQFMRAATEARGYGDLYKAQVDLTKDAAEQMMAESKTNLQMATSARDEYRSWYESTLTEMRKRTGMTEASASA